jgi:hypothetical protein
MRHVKSHKRSSKISEIRQFLSTFRDRFFQDRQIIDTIDKLTKNDQSFYWSKNCQITFEQLKKRVIETFLLSYFSHELETFLKSNSSDYVSAKIYLKKRLMI